MEYKDLVNLIKRTPDLDLLNRKLIYFEVDDDLSFMINTDPRRLLKHLDADLLNYFTIVSDLLKDLTSSQSVHELRVALSTCRPVVKDYI